MKTILVSNGASNYLPNIIIQISKEDLGELVVNGELQRIKETNDDPLQRGEQYFQETRIEVL